MISPKEIKSQRHSESGRMERAFIYELVLELVRGVKLAVVKFDLGFLGKLAEFFQFLFKLTLIRAKLLLDDLLLIEIEPNPSCYLIERFLVIALLPLKMEVELSLGRILK